MNSDTTYKIITTSLDASLELGRKVGRALKGGQIIELISDLGGGKTVLVKGIAQGLGYAKEVTSPTFTVSRIYQLPNGLEFHHFDFYRLDSTDIVVRELSEVLGDPEVIVVIEWAANAGDILPSDRLRLTIDRLSESKRQITVEALGQKHQPVIEAIL